MKHIFLVASLLSFSALASFERTPDVPGVRAFTPTSIPQVLAQAPTETPAAPGFFQGLVQKFVTPEGIASLATVLLGIFGSFKFLDARRKQQIAIVTQHAFNGVLDFSKTTETEVDDKIAAGLKIADDWMKAQGWRALTEQEQAVVKLGFNALHGAAEQAKSIATAAVAAGTPLERALTEASKPSPQ